MKSYIHYISLLFSLLITGPSLFSQTDTPITVRVISHDAKLIGTSMGGVDIVIRNQSTGEILASGQTTGSTGDTDLLVLKDKSRYGEISTPGTAAFQTNLLLVKPVYAEIEATFHSAYTGYPVTMTQTRWLIPGKEMTGDGILLDMPGFAMRILHPSPHQNIKKGENEHIDLYMVMLCGCPISPGGTWDSDPMEVEAMVYEGEELLRSIPFENYETNHFRADLSDLKAGTYRIFVSAFDPRSKNSGVEKVDVTIGD